MATRLRKVRRLRGSRTHGWGTSGQHRESGMQGGRGKSGWCKSKWTHVVKYEPGRIGKSGYRCPTGKGKLVAVNVGDLEELSRQTGTTDEKNTVTTLDLSKLGYQKLLGEGRVATALQVIVNEWSKTAEKKIQDSGGKILAPQKNGV